MANSNVLASGTTAAQSSTVAVTTAGKTLSIFAAAGAQPTGIVIPIERLNSNAAWTQTGLALSFAPNSVTGAPQTFVYLSAPGSYRANRPVTSVAVGVDVDDAT